MYRKIKIHTKYIYKKLYIQNRVNYLFNFTPSIFFKKRTGSQQQTKYIIFLFISLILEYVTNIYPPRAPSLPPFERGIF